jgi:nicotinate-nucleotide--dimethylbenzimidazole phosphoribosyltransferase
MSESIEETCRRIGPADRAVLEAAQARQLSLTKPPGSLGRLEEIGNRLAAICGLPPAVPMAKRLYVAAADHGVTAEGVSAYPREVTYQMVYNFLAGGAAVNVLARHARIDVQVVDAGVDHAFPPDAPLLHRKIVRGTANFVYGPAMTRGQAEQSVLAGIDLARAARQDGIGLLGIGEMGIGNTTAASAITAALTGCPVQEATGRGTGLDAAGLARKAAVIERALAVNRPDRGDPLDVLARVGGAEIGVMMGVALGAAAERLPVVADGFISTAAAALAVACCPPVRDYLFLAHRSEEPGHAALAGFIGQTPILDLGMRLGEGTGAALAMPVIEAAGRLLAEMATFEGARVSGKAR